MMLTYKLENNKIIISGKDDFNPKHILECGQIFRFYINNSGNYVVHSLDKKAEIEEGPSGYIIYTNEPEYFAEFFNLSTDYSKIKTDISSLSPVIKTATENAYGLRILKQDLFETLVSFIISANNNIKRIKLIINRLCNAVGRKIDDYHAFPTPSEFAGLDTAFFESIGAGYRAPFLAEVKEAYSLLIKEDFGAMSDIILRKRLMEIKGVGPKVADCIMLFSFNRKKVFPVDVWMERVYNENFGTEKLSRPEISKCLTDKFGGLSGFIQQYLFYLKTVKN